MGEQCHVLGDLLSTRPGCEDEAETWYTRSMHEALRQNALSTALRTATSHARLLVRRGDPDAARRLLEPVYERFTEGFELRDLLEARELLRALA